MPRKFPSDQGKREELAREAAKIGAQALRIMSVATMERSEEQILADSNLPSKEAPFYLHAAAKISEVIVKTEATEAAPRTLNLTLVSGAESREQWLEEVRKAKVLDVPFVPSLPPKEPVAP